MCYRTSVTNLHESTNNLLLVTHGFLSILRPVGVDWENDVREYPEAKVSVE